MTRLYMIGGVILLVLALIATNIYTLMGYTRRGLEIDALAKTVHAQAAGTVAMQKAEAQRARVAAGLRKQLAETKSKLDAALAKSPDWANTPVPPEVSDALR